MFPSPGQTGWLSTQLNEISGRLAPDAHRAPLPQMMHPTIVGFDAEEYRPPHEVPTFPETVQYVKAGAASLQKMAPAPKSNPHPRFCAMTQFVKVGAAPRMQYMPPALSPPLPAIVQRTTEGEAPRHEMPPASAPKLRAIVQKSSAGFAPSAQVTPPPRFSAMVQSKILGEAPMQVMPPDEPCGS